MGIERLAEFCSMGIERSAKFARCELNVQLSFAIKLSVHHTFQVKKNISC